MYIHTFDTRKHKEMVTFPHYFFIYAAFSKTGFEQFSEKCTNNGTFHISFNVTIWTTFLLQKLFILHDIDLVNIGNIPITFSDNIHPQFKPLNATIAQKLEKNKTISWNF